MKEFLRLKISLTLVRLVMIVAAVSIPLSCFSVHAHAQDTITITEFPIPTSPGSSYGITAGPDGNLWFTELLSNRIGRITPYGTVTEFVLPTTCMDATYGCQPIGITSGPDGNLWFTEYAGNKIGRITPSGAITEFALPTTCGQPTTGCIPWDITAGPDGNLWFTEVADQANRIGRITPSGTITEFALPTSCTYLSTGGCQLEGITVGPDGNLWFVENTGNAIGRITSSGTITEFTLPTTCRAISPFGCSPTDITAGPDGNLWFAEFYGNAIGRITPSGTITEFTLPTTCVTTPPTCAPYGITAGPDGNLWFTEVAQPQGTFIGSITPNGAITEYPMPNPNNNSADIATGPDGNVWFTEVNGNEPLNIGRVNLTVPNNQPPLINGLSNVTINEGDTYTASGSFTDPDSTSWTATVDYGDSSGVHPLTLNPDNTFSLSHVYKDNGTYTITVSVTDNQGATGTGVASITVKNVSPTVGTISVSPNPVQINTAITASANFTDPGVLDTHIASWNWGDGNTTTGTVTETNGSGSVSDTHTYSTTGVYTITLTVTDKDNGQGTQTFQYVSVYNPTAQSLFSAGQHFSSPAGAYPQNPNLTGTVKFGLSYKYQGGMPVGDRQFTMDFKAANLTFNATTINALVVSNGFATLTGTGTINGSGNYNFLVTGVDGGGIRIQITDPSNNSVVIYDTQPGAAATATPSTPVTGNVIVH